MKPTSILPILILGLSVLTACSKSSSSRETLFVNDAEPDAPSSVRKGAAWKELETSMPPWPTDSDLAKLEVSEPTNRLSFLVDTKHLSVGKDQIIRYTLVVRSPSGAENVSFEGIRCTLNGDYKIYGYGSGNAVKPAAETDWLLIPGSGPGSYRDDLWRHYFCVRRSTTPRPQKEIIYSLKSGGGGGAGTELMAD